MDGDLKQGRRRLSHAVPRRRRRRIAVLRFDVDVETGSDAEVLTFDFPSVDGKQPLLRLRWGRRSFRYPSESALTQDQRHVIDRPEPLRFVECDEQGTGTEFGDTISPIVHLHASRWRSWFRPRRGTRVTLRMSSWVRSRSSAISKDPYSSPRRARSSRGRRVEGAARHARSDLLAQSNRNLLIGSYFQASRDFLGMPDEQVPEAKKPFLAIAFRRRSEVSQIVCG